MKNCQASALRDQRNNMRPGEVLIQADFAENYSIRHQNEIMEAHWSNLPGVAILTAVCYFHKTDSSNVTSQSYAVVSDATKNGTLEMACFMNSILNHLNNSDISFGRHVYIWTDGAAKHFKNRYAMAYLSHFERLYGAPAIWNFTESYHGKGPMDGIGAVLKHNVYFSVLRGQVTVSNALDFFDAAQKITTNVTILFKSQDEVTERAPEFLKLWGDTRECKGILKARCVKTQGPYLLILKSFYFYIFNPFFLIIYNLHAHYS